MRSKGLKVLCVVALTALLSACGGGGMIKRVSEPAVGIQQLTVQADGTWSVDLRIDNFSSVPMTFDTVSLAIKIGDEDAGTLTASPALPVGPESADIATIKLTPTSAARIAMADALASRQTISYSLDGTVGASADGRQRTFQLERRNQLNPVPGLPGVLR
jgi:hypothetical protein